MATTATIKYGPFFLPPLPLIRWTLDETQSYYTAPKENIPKCYSVTFMPAPFLEFRYLNDVTKVKKGISFYICHS